MGFWSVDKNSFDEKIIWQNKLLLFKLSSQKLGYCSGQFEE